MACIGLQGFRKEKETFEFSYTTRWIHKNTKEDKWFFARVRPYCIDGNGNMVFDLHIILQLTTPPLATGNDWSYCYTTDDGSKFIRNKNEPVKLEVKLTNKEKQISSLLLEDLDSEEIAGKLVISVNTVYTHRKNIFEKIKCEKYSGNDADSDDEQDSLSH